MQFQVITLSIPVIDPAHQSASLVSIAATQGEGTGLAYHLDLFPAPGRDPGGYCLTHVESGYGLCSMTLSSTQQVQIFLERVAALDPDQWCIDLTTFKKRYPQGKQARLMALITQIYTAVQEEGRANLPPASSRAEDASVALRGPHPHPTAGEIAR